MIIVDTEQGSLDWLTARLWRLTASALKANITATGQLSKSQAAIAGIDKLIAGLDAANEIRTNPDSIAGMDDWQIQEWIGHYTGEKFAGNKHTRRGNDLEPDALAALQDRIGMQIDPVGMCIMGEDPNGVVSCSPDGLIYHDGILVAGAEVKCPTLATFYGYLADGGLPDEYKLQCHAGMAICEVDEWHFAAHFRGKPLFYVHVPADGFTEKLGDSLQDFRKMYEERFWEISCAMKKISGTIKARHGGRKAMSKTIDAIPPLSAPPCPLCGGNGHYMYDYHHGKPCEQCCKHDAGWWDITEHHAGYVAGSDNGCCRAGCGQLRRELQQANAVITHDKCSKELGA